ncbi:MAG: hypothetical protein ACFE91_05105 [Promethearchaeota archaeon]
MLSVSYDNMFMNFTQKFLQSFEEIADCDFQAGTYFDFEIEGRAQKKRINPLIRKANLEDINEIVFIYRDIYENSYPYKEMEDRDEIKIMLESPNVEWLIFETISGEIVGCFTFILDFAKKLGNIRGFVIKKKFLGKVDIMKMAMGSIIAMYKKYNDKIFRWYGECRTAHTKSQYFCSAFGFKPVGFYPCKDVFFNKVESDLLIISYDERALTTMRSKEIPKILPDAINGFLYSDRRYNLDSYSIYNSNNLNLNECKIKELRKSLSKSISKDKFGYETIKFSFTNSDSYFEFLYTPTVQNFEKTQYKINYLEELYIFAKEFLKFGKKYKIRYCEAFISAYKPTHQKIFYNLGLSPRGYVPSWKYNEKTGRFEDCILFNWYEGEINNIELLDEGKRLLDILGIQYTYEKHVGSKQESKKIPLKESNSNKWNEKVTIKSCLMTGLISYLFLLFSSLGIASLGDYKILTHTISELGSIQSTKIPFLFDLSSILGGITTILLNFYLFKRIKLNTTQNLLMSNMNRYRMVSGLLGSIGIIFVGFFNLDRACGLCHSLFCFLAFGGFICSLLVQGIMIFQNEIEIPKSVGLTSIVPLIVFIFHCFFPFPLLEWILLFSIISALLPLLF